MLYTFIRFLRDSDGNIIFNDTRDEVFCEMQGM